MTSSDDDSADPESPQKRLAAVTDAVEIARRRQERAFIPSTTIEALVLQVIGGWEQLKAAVNMYRFLDAGPGAELPGEENLPGVMRKIAQQHRIRWPHDRFAVSVNQANQVRQRFAHFFYVSSILGNESPDRTLYFTRLGGAGDSFKAKRGALGLEWIDDEWARQNRHEDSITERELRETLAELKSMIEWCLALARLAQILSHSPDLPDDHPITTSGWWIPWRTEKEPLLLLRDLRLPEPEPEPAKEPLCRRVLNWIAGQRK